ncbi:magnesium protoporphyrin IX methyltransferase [Rhodopseudomonas palustris]|uniref:Magnesium protoporphyrin IX methyltransferase n=1 Tax=Rhodopseudomonas palustris TaxID=1076 RepID=A0A323UZZ6_RHOPL|nr:magnesium protoporphyrin IX methyltransferase [Rhodopseudomonas palustris]PZA13488.1 magnesium protoporphyrin IX methyltransferase [Rhodopseudomonas palustris]
MALGSYIERRGELETYFDRTAADTWAKLTSDAPVSGIRATVRAGRDEMRSTLLSWLPADMTGTRLLDAGCGTGALSIEAARRGAKIVAIDLSPTLVAVARERLPADIDPAAIDFRSGDMLDPELGEFDFVVAMDSLIHYLPHDICRMLATLASRTHQSMAVTFAPKTPLLTVMHFVGGFFPRSDRAPAIEPISEKTLRSLVAAEPLLAQWQPGRTHRVSSGFYTSQALEMVRR